MKESLLTFLLVSLLFNGGYAQNYKHIYKNSGPDIRVPTNLIDTVRVAAGNLNVKLKSGEMLTVMQSSIDSILYKRGQVVMPSELGSLRIGSVMGVVVDENGHGVDSIQVHAGFGSEYATTDSNGVFFLDSIEVYEKLGLVTAEKAGYFKMSRSFIPLPSGRNLIRIQLSPRLLAGTFLASSGGTISTGTLGLEFPPNAISLNGIPFTGNVNVYATVFNPTELRFHDRMPGDLLGAKNDSLRLLQSYGMADIELESDGGEKLQISQGMAADLSLVIPDTMFNQAPATIDFWSYDHNLGYWQLEGIATRNGNNYTGQATHFSPWNFDMGFTPVQVLIEYKDSINIPLVDGLVVTDNWNFSDGPSSYTNSDGRVIFNVRPNQITNFSLLQYCNSNNDWLEIDNFNSIVPLAGLNFERVVNSINLYRIRGLLTDCNGNFINRGYVITSDDQIAFTDSGRFELRICAAINIQIRGFWQRENQLLASTLQNILVSENLNINSNIEVCAPYQPAIGDIYQGGVITYLFQPNDLGYDPAVPHGLISAQNDIYPTRWDCTGLSVPNTYSEIGTGLNNTAIIAGTCPQSPYSAAKSCYNLLYNGYTDWFLPSLNELVKVYQQRNTIGGFINTFYWSSTEYNSANAYVINFTNGNITPVAKDAANYSVRPMRYF